MGSELVCGQRPINMLLKYYTRTPWPCFTMAWVWVVKCVHLNEVVREALCFYPLSIVKEWGPFTCWRISLDPPSREKIGAAINVTRCFAFGMAWANASTLPELCSCYAATSFQFSTAEPLHLASARRPSNWILLGRPAPPGQLKVSTFTVYDLPGYSASLCLWLVKFSVSSWWAGNDSVFLSSTPPPIWITLFHRKMIFFFTDNSPKKNNLDFLKLYTRLGEVISWYIVIFLRLHIESNILRCFEFTFKHHYDIDPLWIISSINW